MRNRIRSMVLAAALISLVIGIGGLPRAASAEGYALVPVY